MNIISFICWILLVYYLRGTEGACNAYHGGDVLSDNLDANEDSATLTGLEVLMHGSDYKIRGCKCGTITKWRIYARRNGTVILYAYKPNRKIVGSTSVTIGDQSRDNYFDIPLSSEMWIPVTNGRRLAFYTPGEPMITYGTVTPSNDSEVYYNTGQSETSFDNKLSTSGTTFTDRLYAVAAYVEAGHPPMFVNAPFKATLYTHETGSVIYTAQVLDLDGHDTLTIKDNTNHAGFTLDTSTFELTYSTRQSAGTYTITLALSDDCHDDVTTDIKIKLINEPPRFTLLPASVSISETSTSTAALYTFAPYDNSSDSVTCSISTFNPTPSGFSFTIDGSYNINPSTTPQYNYDTAKYYDLTIDCTDGENHVYSNFVIDVVKNPPPYYNTASGSGLPGVISVERSSGVTIFTLDMADDGTVSVASYPCDDNTAACPFTFGINSGTVTTNAVLEEGHYDIAVTIQDDLGRQVGPYYLSVLTSGRPYTFNAIPVFVNLPATIDILEHTSVGAFIFKVMYTDENINDPFELSWIAPFDDAQTYLDFNASTGIISVKTDINLETTGAVPWIMTIQLVDYNTLPQSNTISNTVTINIVNLNEGLTLTIVNPALSIDETTAARGVEIGNPMITVTDVDAGDTYYVTMDCGADNKYFYFDPADNRVYFAREYDMDAGLSGTATCVVTARDTKGLSDSGNITLTINNVNDHAPRFPHRFYVFRAKPTDTFYTVLGNLAASDHDLPDTPDTLSYSFSPPSPTGTYVQIDADGILSIRNVSTFSTGTYYKFLIVVTDTNGLTGTCDVTVIFSGVQTTITTTTERNYVFLDDYQNYWWLFLCGFAVVVLIVFIVIMVCKDPVVYEYITFKMMKLADWCRRKPKPKEPKRTVGKLTVTVNKKTLENDPDNALPWELLAKDGDVPELNEVQENIQRRQEKRDRDYKDFSGLPVFKKGKGARPESAVSWNSGRDSESPKYATFVGNDGKKVDDGGEGQWGDLSDRRIVVTPVSPVEGATGGDGVKGDGDQTNRNNSKSPANSDAEEDDGIW